MIAAPARTAAGAPQYADTTLFDDIPSTSRLIAAVEAAGMTPVPALGEREVVFTRRSGTATVRSCALDDRPEMAVVETTTVYIDAHPLPYAPQSGEVVVTPQAIGTSATYAALQRLNVARLQRQLAGELVYPPAADPATPGAASDAETPAGTHRRFAAARAAMSYNTRRVYDDALDLLAYYLANEALRPRIVLNLGLAPEGWEGIQDHEVIAFVGWLRGRYRDNTVKMRLSAVKVYARVACMAGAMDALTLGSIEKIRSS